MTVTTRFLSGEKTPKLEQNSVIVQRVALKHFIKP